MALDSTSPLPLYVQLTEALRRRFRDGEWRSGDALPSEAELVDEYGVSRITVARAMSELAREGRVSRQRGRRTIATDPLPPASGSPTLAFLAPRSESDWLLRIYRGFEVVATASGGHPLLTGPRGDAGAGLHQAETFLSAGSVQGLALCHVSITSDERPLLETLRAKGVPLAFIGIYQPNIVADRVLADNVAAGAIATRHLLGLGHRRIAFLYPGRSHLREGRACPGRFEGYRRALVEAGLDPVRDSGGGWVLDEALPAALTDSEQRERLFDFFERGDITAAVTCNDTVAVLVQRYLDAAGVRVPDDLAMVGISDERIAALAKVPLTTVKIDATAMGRAAAELLLSRLAGDEGTPHEIVVPVSLVIRASCGTAASTGEGVVYSVEDAMREAQALLEEVSL